MISSLVFPTLYTGALHVFTFVASSQIFGKIPARNSGKSIGQGVRASEVEKIAYVRGFVARPPGVEIFSLFVPPFLQLLKGNNGWICFLGICICLVEIRIVKQLIFKENKIIPFTVFSCSVLATVLGGGDTMVNKKTDVVLIFLELIFFMGEMDVGLGDGDRQ